MSRSEEILAFWFGPGTVADPRWFRSDPDFDREVGERFGVLLEAPDALEAWASDPRGRLAAILVCDQFARNTFRGTAAAFASDPLARRLAFEGIQRGEDTKLSFYQRAFFYLPFMHGETLELQDYSVALFEGLLEGCSEAERPDAENFFRYAEAHRASIERFGRFPARNEALGRSSTQAEEQFLSGE